MIVHPPELPPLAPYQREHIFTEKRYSVIEATTKVGKTVGCMLWLLEGAWNRKAEYWWVAPIFPQTEIAFKRLCGLLKDADPRRRSWKENQSKIFITLANGAVLHFKSGDRPDGLYGEDVARAVIDESSRCKPEVWHAIRSTLTATRGRCRIIGNVRGRRNWSYELARKAEQGVMGPDWHYAKLTWRDAVAAGILQQEEIDGARKELPDAVFRELYEAEASDDQGNPFGLEAIRACAAPEYEHGVPVVYGVDLARKQDYTWVVGLDAAGNVAVDEHWQSDWPVTINRIAGLVGRTRTLADSTGLGDVVVQMLQRRLPNVEGVLFSTPQKQSMMEGLAVTIQNRAVRFRAGSELHKQLEVFEYVYTRTGARYSAPEGFHDDGVCSLALAVEGRRRVPEVPEVHAFGGRASRIVTETAEQRMARMFGDD